ncbi:MAG: hypothetical protein AAF998_03365 [Bacteroidota bacterium]
MKALLLRLRFSQLLGSLLLLIFLSTGSGVKAITTANATPQVEMEGGKEKQRKSTTKPYKKARASAKDARRAMRLKESQVQGRAKVRNFFHNMFNRKYGKPVNFRSKRQRRRWKKGRMG